MWQAYSLLLAVFLLGFLIGASAVYRSSSKTLREVQQQYEQDHAEFKAAEKKYFDAYKRLLEK